MLQQTYRHYSYIVGAARYEDTLMKRVLQWQGNSGTNGMVYTFFSFLLFFWVCFAAQNKKTGHHVLVYSPAIPLSECAVSRVMSDLDGGGVGLDLDDMRVKR